MSTEALASWLKVRRRHADVQTLLDKGTQPSLVSGDTRGNRILHSLRPPAHHRFFWREESTSASVWAGAYKALAAFDHHERAPAPQIGISGTPAENSKNNVEYLDDSRIPSDLLPKVSERSDLQRLDLLLNTGKIDPACPKTFTAAVHDGNPAIVGMLLSYGKDNASLFKETFRDWGKRDVAGGPSTPLRIACHLGLPHVVSVLLTFMREEYSAAESEQMVNARDCRGRTALHLASWSPQPKCPGRRQATLRSLLASGADVNAKDNNGSTSLHEACRAGDRFAIQILLSGGADPLTGDDCARTPAELAGKKSRARFGQVFRQQLSRAVFLRLIARITAKQTVSRIMRRFEPLCSTCRVRPASACAAKKEQNFAAWLYVHKRWPKAGEGTWIDLPPLCLETAKRNAPVL